MRRKQFRAEYKMAKAITFDPTSMTGEPNYLRVKIGRPGTSSPVGTIVGIDDPGCEFALVLPKSLLAELGLGDLEPIGSGQMIQAAGDAEEVDIVEVDLAVVCQRSDERHWVTRVQVAIQEGTGEAIVGKALTDLYDKATSGGKIIYLAPGPAFENLADVENLRPFSSWNPYGGIGERWAEGAVATASNVDTRSNLAPPMTAPKSPESPKSLKPLKPAGFATARPRAFNPPTPPKLPVRSK